ncbi:MAG: DUF3619 family protein [Betaproteobacteria bacterium]|nr:DUF3619 family protein [Betaproteobacteria bacterium]
MNQPEDELGGKIAGHLEAGLARMDQGTRERLLVARKLALSRYRDEPAPAGAWAWAGRTVARFGGHHPHALRYALGAVALITALIGVTYWQSNSGPANGVADIDARILTDELPINAYLDKGFDSWLKRSSR